MPRADRLPGLIVDRYGDYLVMQTLNQGMDAAKSAIASCLEEIFAPRGIVARNDAAVRTKENLPLETAILAGDVPPAVSLRMNGLEMRADLLRGQKTGVFLDQRRELPCRRPLRARRPRTRLLHVHRRLRATSRGRDRIGGSGR